MRADCYARLDTFYTQLKAKEVYPDIKPSPNPDQNPNPNTLTLLLTLTLTLTLTLPKL